MYVRMCVCVYVCMCVCECVCIYVGVSMYPCIPDSSQPLPSTTETAERMQAQAQAYIPQTNPKGIRVRQDSIEPFAKHIATAFNPNERAWTTIERTHISTEDKYHPENYTYS